jgi:hypothetical protein
MRRSWAGSRYIKCPWSKLVATRWLLSALCPRRSTWWPLGGFHIVEFLLWDFVLLDSSFNWFEFSSKENSGRNLVDSVAAKSASFRWDNWEPRWWAAKQNTVSNFAFHLQFLLPGSASQYSEVLLPTSRKGCNRVLAFLIMSMGISGFWWELYLHFSSNSVPGSGLSNYSNCYKGGATR